MNIYVGNGIPTWLHQLVATMVSGWASSQDPKVRGVLLAKEPQDILNQILAGRCIAVMSEDNIDVLGFATLWENSSQNSEYGTVVVNPRFRGRGLSKFIYAAVQELHSAIGGELWETTHNPLIVRRSEAVGFTSVSYDMVPDGVRKGLCLEASCFVEDPKRPGRCKDEWNAGGDCYLCHRCPTLLEQAPEAPLSVVDGEVQLRAK